jgi:hypothetical protein
MSFESIKLKVRSEKYTLIAWACMISSLLRAAFLWFGCHSTSLIYMMQKKQKLIAWLILLCVIFIHIVYHFEIGMSEQRVFFFFYKKYLNTFSNGNFTISIHTYFILIIIFFLFVNSYIIGGRIMEWEICWLQSLRLC